MNKALHGKWIWRYLNGDDSLWKKIIEIKWAIKDYNGNLTLVNRAHDLSLWRGIMDMYSRVLDCIRSEVGNCNKIRF